MERESLEAFLYQGLSLEAIGQQTGKHASTVAYWLRKHGLIAVHRDKFAPKGGIRKEALVELVNADRTLSEMAAELDVSIATVRYWLRRYGLKRACPSRLESRPPTQGCRPSLLKAREDEVRLGRPRLLPVRELPAGGGIRVAAPDEGEVGCRGRGEVSRVWLRPLPRRPAVPPCRSCNEGVQPLGQGTYPVARADPRRAQKMHPALRQLPRRGRGRSGSA